LRPEQFERAKQVLADAIARPLSLRPAFLDGACGDDAELRAEVDSLLAQAGHAMPSLLATAGIGAVLAPNLLGEIGDAIAAVPGQHIGPYEIVRVLGEGGMGTVYHARQTEPLRRDVAIKIIKRGMDTARVVARFETERQTLALMDHPSIARVLDAGADDRGHPYFVMELVHGVPITEYADRNRLPIAERLGLFLQVCQAVQHAHQKGVLHRDLKPSNVLVTEHDGIALPKVIDFGVAKAIEASLVPGQSLFTEAGQLVGTPEYMSPEQAGVRPGGADTRSDVYSLGVLLYELLTGHRPYRLRGLMLTEIQRVIGHQEPVKPSTAVTTPVDPLPAAATPTTTAIGEARSSTLNRLGRQLSGDLDNIVLMSLRKEPERRYPSVEQFAADIRRHLNGLPVHARRDTWAYRSSKFARRHRFGVGIAAAAMLALAVFTASLVRERNRARSAEGRAQAEAATAGEVSKFLVGLFERADPFVSQGGDVTARTLLDQGAARIERELEDQPQIQAALLGTMSRAYIGLRVGDRSVPLAQQSLEKRRAIYGPRHAEVASGLVTLAAALGSRSDSAAAEPLFRDALAMRRELLGPDHPDIIESLSLYALNQQTLGKNAEAEPMYREALAMTRRIRGEQHADVTSALQNLGGVLHAQGKVDEALQYLQEALARARTQAAAPLLTADIMAELAVLLKNMKRNADAEPMYRESLAIRQKTMGDHPITASSHNNLGVFLRGLGDQDGGLEQQELALAMYRRALGENHRDVALAHANMAAAYRGLGRKEEATRSYLAALAAMEASMGRKYWAYGQVQFNYGTFLRDQRRFIEAEPLIVQGYESVRDGLGAASRRAQQSLEGVITLYEQWGKPARAAEYRKLVVAGK
jgi:eukaryotic-like serine/threonine-protein kinase